MYMAQGMKQIPTANIILRRRSRNSSRCEIRVPSARPSGSPASPVGRIGVCRRGGWCGDRRLGCRRIVGMHGCRRGELGGRSINRLGRGRRRWRDGRRWRGSQLGGIAAARRRVRGGVRLDLRLQEFFRVDFAFQLFGQLARHDARAPHPVAHSACNLGKSLRPQHDECYGRGEQYLREPDIKHAASSVGFWGRLDFGLARRRAGLEVRVLVLFDLLHFLFGFAVIHGLLEALDRDAQIRADTAYALGAEYHQRNEQYDDQHSCIEHVGSPILKVNLIGAPMIRQWDYDIGPRDIDARSVAFEIARNQLSSQKVTGPSLVSDTRMWAPNTPVSTRPCWVRAAFTKASNKRRPCSGGAAVEKPGRKPLRVSAARVNWGTSSKLPCVCPKFKFIFPASSSNTRY